MQELSTHLAHIYVQQHTTRLAAGVELDDFPVMMTCCSAADLRAANRVQYPMSNKDLLTLYVQRRNTKHSRGPWTGR
jgi:hypothetical protein